MRGPPLVLLAWAALLSLHTLVLVGLGGDTLEVALLGGAAAGVALLAALAAVLGRAAPTRRVRELSLPAALASVAVAGLLLGAELGTWLMLISGGLLLLALGGLVRE